MAPTRALSRLDRAVITAASSVPIGVALFASAGAFGAYLPFSIRESRRLEMAWAAEANWEIDHPIARIIAISPATLTNQRRGRTAIAIPSVDDEPGILWWRAPSDVAAPRREDEVALLSWQPPAASVATVLCSRAPQGVGHESGDETLTETLDDDLAAAAA